MNSSNYKSYCDELNDVIKNYPGLSVTERDNKKILKGILDITNDDQNIIGHYLVEIHFSNGFPFRFPKLYEKGGAIPNHADWHKYDDHRCCITVLPDEIIKCKSGITIVEFIKRYCCSFFANHIHRKLTGNYLNGEYSHGKEGLEEFYTELLKTYDSKSWIKYIDHVFKGAIFSTERNDDCFCGSKDKFKKCHKLIFDKIWDIGRQQTVSDLKIILT